MVYVGLKLASVLSIVMVLKLYSVDNMEGAILFCGAAILTQLMAMEEKMK